MSILVLQLMLMLWFTWCWLMMSFMGSSLRLLQLVKMYVVLLKFWINVLLLTFYSNCFRSWVNKKTIWWLNPLFDCMKTGSWQFNFLSISRWVECQQSAFLRKMVGLALIIACTWPLQTSGLRFSSNLLLLFCSTNTACYLMFPLK